MQRRFLKFRLKNLGICAKYIIDGKACCHRCNRRATHTAPERQANVTPFDIIINKSETP
jgi:hypothetical protein